MAVVLYDDDLFVSYGFGSLTPPDAVGPDLSAACKGQSNGLLGGAAEGFAVWTFALHTGPEPLRIEWCETVPPLEDSWEDVVEASATFYSTDVILWSFDPGPELVLGAAGHHRLRFSARGMDAAVELDSRDEDDDIPAPDRYLLQLWPAAPASDAVLRVGSEFAARRHREATGEPHPVRPDEAELDQLHLVFGRAAPDRQVEALAFLADRIVAATELTDEPVAVEVPHHVRRRETRAAHRDDLQDLEFRLYQQSPPATVRGDDYMRALGWRRMQAGMVLSHIIGRPAALVVAEPEPFGLFFHARLALADSWPEVRDGLRARLR